MSAGEGRGRLIADAGAGVAGVGGSGEGKGGELQLFARRVVNDTATLHQRAKVTAPRPATPPPRPPTRLANSCTSLQDAILDQSLGGYVLAIDFRSLFSPRAFNFFCYSFGS